MSTAPRGPTPEPPVARATRRARGSVGLLLAVASAIAGCGEPAPAPREVRSIVLITIDTLRADHVGVNGGPVPTPAIDALAHEGVTLTTAYTPMASTGPAHTSLFTGMHPWRHGVLRNAVPLAEPNTLLAHRMLDSGRRTAAFVASYIVDARFGFARGFERYHFEPSESYGWRGVERERFWSRGESVTDAALAWLDGRDAAPFFLWVHYFDPHSPYAPPPGFERPADEEVDLASKRLPAGFASEHGLAAAIRAYRGEVGYADAQVGRLVEGLRARGLLDQSAVVLTADHGEGLGDHGLLEHGHNNFEELVRVPMILRIPGVRGGRRLEGLAQLEDLMPTLLAIVNLPAPEDIDGVDLLPWIRGAVPESPRAEVYGRRKQLERQPDQYFARSADRKWIGRLDGPGRRYDLAADPRELAGAPGDGPPPGLAAAVGDDPGPGRRRQVDPETLRALGALGYAE